jgi:Xrn1 helical domain
MLLLNREDAKSMIGQRLKGTFSPEQAGRPLSPVCQLLAVLPPESADLLPKAHASLMLEEKSRAYFMFHPPNGAEDFEYILGTFFLRRVFCVCFASPPNP